MRTLDDFGKVLERKLDSVEHRFGGSIPGSIAVGALLALGVIGGGIATFILVLAVLVRFFS